jgi:hypothetical protein
MTPIQHLIQEIKGWRMEKVWVNNVPSFNPYEMPPMFDTSRKRFLLYVEKDCECWNRAQIDCMGDPYPGAVSHIVPEYLHNDYDFELEVDELGIFDRLELLNDYGGFRTKFDGQDYVFLNSYDGGMDDDEVVRKGNKPLFWTSTLTPDGVLELATWEYNPATLDIELGYHMMSEPIHPGNRSYKKITDCYGTKRSAYFSPTERTVSLGTIKHIWEAWPHDMRVNNEPTQEGVISIPLTRYRIYVPVKPVKPR